MRIQNQLIVACAVLLMFSFGCYRHATRERISPADIPDGLYEIYVHSRTYDAYAVLLDIPDDGIRVFMRHTDRTERMGMGRPEPYIAEFQKRIRGFGSTIRITDSKGSERGYLMVSTSLSYLIQPYRGDIMVSIWEPFTDQEFGPRLGPEIEWRRSGFH